MRKIARYIYLGTAWVELVSLFIPIFVAGMALFVRNSYWSTHREIGWLTGWPLTVLIITGLLGWIPRRLTAWLVALIVLHAVHTILPTLRTDAPLFAAIHPVSAVLLVSVAYVHARRATELLIKGAPAPEGVAGFEATTQV